MSRYVEHYCLVIYNTQMARLIDRHDIQFSVLASDNVSGGFSGAELIAICREAALLAIEEDDERLEASSSPRIAMRHLIRAISEMQRQVTPEMLDFYASFNTKRLV